MQMDRSVALKFPTNSVSASANGKGKYRFDQTVQRKKEKNVCDSTKQRRNLVQCRFARR